MVLDLPHNHKVIVTTEEPGPYGGPFLPHLAMMAGQTSGRFRGRGVQ